MKRDIPSSADEPLRELLRSARPEATLPPRFEESVWQRIARPEPRSPHRFSAWLDTLVEWTAQPRWAFGGLAVVLTLGLFLGTLRGFDDAKQEARARYVAAVAPVGGGR